MLEEEEHSSVLLMPIVITDTSPTMHPMRYVVLVGKRVWYTSTTSIVSQKNTCEYEIMNCYH
jgi:hypothetical protein